MLFKENVLHKGKSQTQGRVMKSDCHKITKLKWDDMSECAPGNHQNYTS